MKLPHRPRVGLAGDTIWERKRLWCLPIPFQVGYHPVANTSSARNRIVAKLNKKAEEVMNLFDELADAEAMMEAEMKSLLTKGFGKYGVGEVQALDTAKDLKGMYPMFPDQEPAFESVFFKIHLTRARLEAGVEVEKTNQRKSGAQIPTVMVTSPKGKEFSTPGIDAEHVVAYVSPNTGPKGNKKSDKEGLRVYRQDNPKQSHETKDEWNQRTAGEFRGEDG